MKTVAMLQAIALLLSAPGAAVGQELGVLGLGSNVVDKFYRLRGEGGMKAVMGEKGYFASDGEVVGGVTLNHLSWARALGVPTALAALQGEDEAGKSIRSAMKEHGISDGALAVRPGVSSSVSHVLLEESGGRTILMAPHSTSALTRSEVDALFVPSLDAGVRLVTSEVSQVPLSGVAALLEGAHARGIPTLLDVDVPPSIAAGAAKLCDQPADVLALAKTPTVLKTTRNGAIELLALAGEKKPATGLGELAKQLRKVLGVRLVAVTDGEHGGALASESGAVAEQKPPPSRVSESELDTTGAGDAFFGGLIAVLWRLGLGADGGEGDGGGSGRAGEVKGVGALPRDKKALSHVLRVASASGTAGCTFLGGLPPPDHSAARAKVVAMVGAQTKAEEWLPAVSAEGTPEAVTVSPNGAAAASAHTLAADEKEEHARSLADDARTAAHLAEDMALRAALSSAAAAVHAVRASGGVCLVTALGKSGSVARRLAASLASTGMRAHFVHAAEWAHGDLGNLAGGPTALIAISHSGKTAEVAGVAREASSRGLPVVAIVGGGAKAAAASPLGSVATQVVGYALPGGVVEPFGGAPTASIVAQEMAANALVRALASRIGFDARQFKVNHPGGALGAALAGTN